MWKSEVIIKTLPVPLGIHLKINQAFSAVVVAWDSWRIASAGTPMSINTAAVADASVWPTPAGSAPDTMTLTTRPSAFTEKNSSTLFMTNDLVVSSHFKLLSSQIFDHFWETSNIWLLPHQKFHVKLLHFPFLSHMFCVEGSLAPKILDTFQELPH